MLHRLQLLLVLIIFCVYSSAQTAPSTSCGQAEIMQRLYATHPEYKQLNEQIETALKTRNQLINSGELRSQRTNAIVTLPVVVHIIHNGGAENITDAQVLQGIQHLNEAYANTGYYDPSDGVNTEIQFCMAQRDPSNNATNGITRDVSAYTTMGGANYYSDDQNVKNINRWNPLCYINIWLVKSIPTSVVGYAYLPSAHGSNVDGIIIEAGYFGSSFSNDVVAAHEMGHYLGLYHTFEGNCTNNDCTTDGDKVCDTPPDQSTAGISCTSSANSCTTDVLSGFATDQNDLTQDYMDYGNFNCMKVFTQGQADRMNWFIQNVRQSLLACKSCMNPCPAPVTANFTTPSAPYIAGASYTFTNTSVNAASYEWYVNGVLKSSTANLNYTFPAAGSFIIKLVAHSGNALCDDSSKTITLNAVCSGTAGFTKSAAISPAGTPVNFTNTSTGADAYEWLVNNVSQSTSASFSYNSTTGGKYAVKLIAKNSVTGCRFEFIDTIEYTCAVVADFIPDRPTSLVNVPVTFTSTSTGATSWQWLVNSVVAGTGPTFTYTFTNEALYGVQLIAGNGICSAYKTTLVLITDKCGNAQYQFQKTYGIGQNSGAYSIQPTADGGSVLSERLVTTGVTYANATILKLDVAGNSQWAYTYNNNTNASFAKVKPTMDGGYIAIGQMQAPGIQGALESFIVKTTATGALSWEKEITVTNTFANFGTDIIESADGSYYFTGAIENPGANGSSDVMVGKLNGSGNLLWIIGYDARGSETGNSLAEDNTHLIVCGNKSGTAGNAGFLLQLNKTDGSVVYAKAYQSTTENFLDVQVAPAGYFVNAQRINNTSGLYTDHVFLETDINGKLSYSKYLQPFGTGKEIGRSAAVLKTNGNIISQTSGAFGGVYNDFLIQEINTSTGILWTKLYYKTNAWLNTIAVTPDNSIWAAGQSMEATAPPLQTYVMKLDSIGGSGNCPSGNATLQLLTADYNTSTADFKATTAQAQINSAHTETRIDVINNIICQFLKCDSVVHNLDTCVKCDAFHIFPPAPVCNFRDSVLVEYIRDTTCIFPFELKVDSTIAQVIPVNGHNFYIKFKKPGTTKLYAQINSFCGLVQDSVVLNAYDTSPKAINLGPDIQLCKFSSVKLSAGSGFASYLWNDGSVDSILTAYNPGQYFVKATAYCGNVYSDTINLSQAPDVPFDLGPDLQICDNDTLTIAAPGSFSSYTWAANYNISSIKGSTVKIWPASDTTYTVIAQVALGCTVLDTIRVKVNRSAPLHLGNDSSFCAGDSLVIHAPAGFKNYLWQDGSTGLDYTAKQKGIYWLHAQTNNGCISKDSVLITDVYPLPSNFLLPVINKCDTKTIDIKAIGSWPSYLWFNNSTASSVSISNGGQYWLQVKSINGCTARDTVVVTDKPCGTGIYFPNVFTPDGNGYNDTYKAIVNDLPVSFRLRIYNRFGEKVFESTDYKQGWDGIYKGRLQPPDTYVWYCNYQFAGSFEKLEKGTLILVR